MTKEFLDKQEVKVRSTWCSWPAHPEPQSKHLLTLLSHFEDSSRQIGTDKIKDTEALIVSAKFHVLLLLSDRFSVSRPTENTYYAVGDFIHVGRVDKRDVYMEADQSTPTVTGEPYDWILVNCSCKGIAIGTVI